MNDYKEIFLDLRVASFWSVSARLEYVMDGRLAVGLLLAPRLKFRTAGWNTLSNQNI